MVHVPNISKLLIDTAAFLTHTLFNTHNLLHVTLILCSR